MASRSLLDPIPHRSRGVMTSLSSRDDDDEAPLPGTFRHYQGLMRREFRDQPIPTLADVISGAWGYATCQDTQVRRAIGLGLTRTMTGIQGSSGGFTIAPGMAQDIFDRARNTVGPWSFAGWERVASREYYMPISGELSSSADMSASWGYGETALPAASDGTLGRLVGEANRLLIYTTISRDLLADAGGIGRWLKYTGLRKIRSGIESAMITGPVTTSGLPSPMGLISSPAGVVVKRASSSTIGISDIDKMWQGIAAASKPRAVWFAGSGAIEEIESLDSGGQYPRILQYRGPFDGDAPTPAGSIKGRPLWHLPSCAALGTPGDIVCADWTQYVLTYMQLNTMDSPLSFNFAPPRDERHRGIVGLPEDAVESRISDEFLLSQDELAIVFKYRGDGLWLWPGTVTENGVTVGPCSSLSS